jgi:hypothetical protein
MSEHLWKFLLSELSTLRIVCQHENGGNKCGAAIEVTVDHLFGKDERLKCPICQNTIAAPDGMKGDYLKTFAGVVKALQNSGLDISFITQATKP